MNASGNAIAACDTLLTLTVPAEAGAVVLDHLLARSAWASGFTCATVEARGATIDLRGPGEQVRGSARRLQVQIALDRQAADAVLADLGTALPQRDIVFWMTPLLAFGRLA